MSNSSLPAKSRPISLNRIDNRTGLVSQLHYRSAVKDYRRDQSEGRPWTTNFPFPYLVVARTGERLGFGQGSRDGFQVP